jgi:predicted O-methyltransferase YrrM
MRIQNVPVECAFMKYHPNRFGTVEQAPAWMTMGERVVLYGLIVGLRPASILEIGTFQGGSTLIMCAALDDLGHGDIVCVDPEPRITPENMAAIKHRTTVVAAPSPGALSTASKVAKRPFDFALLDGDHSFDGLVRDVEGILPILADSAHLVFHDAHYYEVKDAIDSCVSAHVELTDAGLISVEVTAHDGPSEGREINWGGLRMLLYSR